MTTGALIELGKVAAAVVALSGLAVLIGKAVRGMLRMVRRLTRLTDEVLGDGDERPGWGKRLTAIEANVAALQAKIREVAHEVKPNGGSSMRDEVRRIAEATGANTPPGAP
ncbi:hypothetical protein [Actinoplanes lobatus]|uniref:Prophage DNA circulation protein n=1 Tax=Actinoplanes lobatus TaxID=113568 RepID=A0A7W7HRC3_9ACTN|nr:hypothetical protein [Actinoplanes lobatus]MBB4755291.1 prophage DNA circulation protein [Actinoplanes lobatus]GIE46423.1 hypothetical protein Alo02nite_93210 [Actinoplanes lobatus]